MTRLVGAGMTMAIHDNPNVPSSDEQMDVLRGP
jgi:hypothetical protein